MIKFAKQRNSYEVARQHGISRVRHLKVGVKLLASVDISTHAPWITQNEQHFLAG
jgi:hypothetical protein